MRNKKLAKGVALLLVGALTFTAMPVSAATVSDNEVIPEDDYCVVQEEASQEVQLDNKVEPQAIESGTTEDGWEYEVITSEDESTKSITITGYLGEETEVVIPTSIKGIAVTGIGNSEVYLYRGRVFVNSSRLTSITIPKSVTNIGAVAFSGCSSLTSITIP